MIQPYHSQLIWVEILINFGGDVNTVEGFLLLDGLLIDMYNLFIGKYNLISDIFVIFLLFGRSWALSYFWLIIQTNYYLFILTPLLWQYWQKDICSTIALLCFNLFLFASILSIPLLPWSNQRLYFADLLLDFLFLRWFQLREWTFEKWNFSLQFLNSCSSLHFLVSLTDYLRNICQSYHCLLKSKNKGP